jgi:hypothetical protein
MNRPCQADVRICVDLVQEGVLSAREALMKVNATSMLSFTQDFLDTGLGMLQLNAWWSHR